MHSFCIKIVAFAVACLALILPAHAVLNKDCDFSQGAVTTAQGFTNCSEELDELFTRAPATATGVSGTNDISFTFSPEIAAIPPDNQAIIFTAVADSTATVRFITSSGTPINAANEGGTNLGSGDIANDQTYLAVYRAAENKWRVIASGAGAGGGGAPVDADYITISANGTLSAERVINSLIAGGITLTDNGANSTLVVSIDTTDSLTWTAVQGFSTSAADTSVLDATSTDAGAAVGPVVTLDRNSATAAVADRLGEVRFRGRDQLGNTQTYGSIINLIIDPVNGTEDGILWLNTAVGGTVGPRFVIGSGLFGSGQADMGVDTVNAANFYDDGININTIYGSLGAVNFWTSPNTFSALATFSTTAADTDVISAQSSEAGATAGPYIDIERLSATPAANDGGGRLRFTGKDSLANTDQMAYLGVVFLDPTATSEDSRLDLAVVTAGTFAAELSLIGTSLFPSADEGLNLGVDDVNRFASIYAGTAISIDKQGEMRWHEGEAGGDNYVAFAAPATLGANRSCVFQDTGSPIPDSCVGDGIDDGAGGSGDNIRVEDGDNGATFTSATDADLEDSLDIEFSLNTATSPDQISATIRANSVAMVTDTTGNVVTSVADGTGIDGTCSSEDCAYTPTFDATEINSATWGAGAFTTFTFAGAGAIDLTYNYATSGTEIMTHADAGAVGPIFNPYHNSATPAAADVIFELLSDGEDSAGNTQSYTRLRSTINDPVSTSEDATLSLGVVTAGTLADELNLTGAALSPAADGGLHLGISDSVRWGNLYIGTAVELDDESLLRFREEEAGGDNFVAFKAPAALTADTTCTFEDDGNPIPDSCVGDGVDDGAGSAAPTNASYVTLGVNATLTDERVLTEGTMLDIADTGAGGTITVNTDINELTEDTAPSQADDFIPFYDTSAATHDKVNPEKIGVGLKSVALLAGAGTLPSGGAIAPCTSVSAFDSGTNDIFLKQCSFNAATDNGIYWTIPAPKSSDETVDWSVRIDWTSTTAVDGSDNVIWTAAAVCFSNDDGINSNAFPTVDTITDTQTAAGDFLSSGNITTITPAGTWAENDMCVLRVTRDANAAGDNFNGTAELINAMLFITTNVNTDN